MWTRAGHNWLFSKTTNKHNHVTLTFNNVWVQMTSWLASQPVSRPHTSTHACSYGHTSPLYPTLYVFTSRQTYICMRYNCYTLHCRKQLCRLQTLICVNIDQCRGKSTVYHLTWWTSWILQLPSFMYTQTPQTNDSTCQHCTSICSLLTKEL